MLPAPPSLPSHGALAVRRKADHCQSHDSSLSLMKLNSAGVTPAGLRDQRGRGSAACKRTPAPAPPLTIPAASKLQPPRTHPLTSPLILISSPAPHIHLPCRHPQRVPRAGPHRPQLGLLLLAWKVGELSAPIQRGQGRGASGRRGEGIESQGSKGTKAMGGTERSSLARAPPESVTDERVGKR